MNRPRIVVALMALLGMMTWTSLALDSRAADDAKATGAKKEAKSEPSKTGTTKLEGKEAPDVNQAALGMTYVDPNADSPVGDFSLASFRGKNIMVLAFFKDAKDNDSVSELDQFRDQLSQLKQNGAVVVGISNTPISRERRLMSKEKVGFPILGDEQSEVCKKYGVIENGKSSRVSFVIDKKGIVRKVIDTKDPKKHAQEVLDAVKNVK